MKTNIFKTVLFTVVTLTLLSGCSKDNDYEVTAFKPMLFSDDFAVTTSPTSLTDRGWTLFSEAGSKNWSEGVYSNDAYAVFTSYQSPDAVNIAWLISPSINLDAHDGEKLLFQAAQAYVSTSANSLEVLISTNFDGNSANVLSATWTPLVFNQPIQDYANNFNYFNSEIDLSAYTGNIHVAFKVKGSGTNATLDGTYQIDNIRVIY